ncbi:hypothetical protein [Snodgrassella alvi]|uniref:hypothetical protein n=1 Tax=Snodgrassella alvi TaxID=1196083 RepID=UPI000C1E11BF|nr:hypothetical protein [Snodgrassella alvi]PIT20142.1 hypothetical protein BGI34_02245 [Snodgrassella alvi]PIT20503.1 hypothetical protein BGI34_02150 [Snodgrassella alvi]
MIARIFNKLWKYSFLGCVLCPFIASFLPLPDDIIKYMFVFFASAFLFLTIVRLLFAMAAPPVVTVRIERDD